LCKREKKKNGRGGGVYRAKKTKKQVKKKQEEKKKKKKSVLNRNRAKSDEKGDKNTAKSRVFGIKMKPTTHRIDMRRKKALIWGAFSPRAPPKPAPRQATRTMPLAGREQWSARAEPRASSRSPNMLQTRCVYCPRVGLSNGVKMGP
jgi:hypothetical protein